MNQTPTDLKSLVGIFTGLINDALPVLVGLALLAFIWGLVKFIFKVNDPKANEEGKNLMKWGLIALFVMVSFMAIVGFFYSDFGFSRPFNPFGPSLPTNPSN